MKVALNTDGVLQSTALRMSLVVTPEFEAAVVVGSGVVVSPASPVALDTISVLSTLEPLEQPLLVAYVCVCARTLPIRFHGGLTYGVPYTFHALDAHIHEPQP